MDRTQPNNLTNNERNSNHGEATSLYAQEKCCTACGKNKILAEFDRNKSKRDGHDARCKSCVSIIKARSYKSKKKKLKERNKFSASVTGSVDVASIEDFARVISAAIKEMVDANETT